MFLNKKKLDNMNIDELNKLEQYSKSRFLVFVLLLPICLMSICCYSYVNNILADMNGIEYVAYTLTVIDVVSIMRYGINYIKVNKILNKKTI